MKAIHHVNLRVTKDTVVCALHWPSGFEEIENLFQKDRPRFGQVYHLVKYQHHLQYHDPQKKFVQAHAALKKINYPSFSVVIK